MITVHLQVRWFPRYRRGIYSMTYEVFGQKYSGMYLLDANEVNNETSAWAASVCEAAGRILLLPDAAGNPLIQNPDIKVRVQGDRFGLPKLPYQEGYLPILEASLQKFQTLCLKPGRVEIAMKRDPKLTYAERTSLEQAYLEALQYGLTQEGATP